MKSTIMIYRLMACLIMFQCFSLSLFAAEIIPQPLIDPLGSLDLYLKSEYSEAKTRVIRASRNSGDGQITIGGDQWIMEATGSGSKETDRQKLVEYLGSLNVASLEVSDRNGNLLAIIIEAGVGKWWLSVDFKDNSYRLTTTLVRLLSPTQDISVDLGGDKRHELIFYTNQDGKHYQTLAVQAPPGFLQINAVMDVEPVNQYVRHVSYSRNLTQNASANYRLGDTPQEAGLYRWKVRLYRDVTEGSLDLKLLQGGELTTIERSAEVGSILVKNLSGTHIYADPEGSVRFKHPTISTGSIRGDILPNGDSLLTVPPGFWRVYTEPPRESASHMLPVKPGQVTVVHWPNYLGRTYRTETQDSLKLTNAEIGESEGSVTLNLLGDQASKISPKLEEFTIREGGQDGKILSIRPIPTPLDIVMLLDSSGSMKGQMATALEATRVFIQSLPEDTRIRLVDFDTRANILPGEDKDAVLHSLDVVKANGATALYDTTIKGMEMLSTSKRPALVLFTDGVDANWDDSGPGSKATKEELFGRDRCVKGTGF